MVISIVLWVVGAILFLVGFVMNNSLEAQLTSFFSGGRKPDTIWIIIGLILIAAGVVFFFWMKKNGGSRGGSQKPTGAVCPACHTPQKPGAAFCSHCGTPLT